MHLTNLGVEPGPDGVILQEMRILPWCSSLSPYFLGEEQETQGGR
jgi:hypothetical protein